MCIQKHVVTYNTRSYLYMGITISNAPSYEQQKNCTYLYDVFIRCITTIKQYCPLIVNESDYQSTWGEYHSIVLRSVTYLGMFTSPVPFALVHVYDVSMLSIYRTSRQVVIKCLLVKNYGCYTHVYEQIMLSIDTQGQKYLSYGSPNMFVYPSDQLGQPSSHPL